MAGDLVVAPGVRGPGGVSAAGEMSVRAFGGPMCLGQLDVREKPNSGENDEESNGTIQGFIPQDIKFLELFSSPAIRFP